MNETQNTDPVVTSSDMNTPEELQSHRKSARFLFLPFLLVLGLGVVAFLNRDRTVVTPSLGDKEKSFEMVAFQNAEEVQRYLDENSQDAFYGSFGRGVGRPEIMMETMAADESVAAPTALPKTAGGQMANRVSETNIQVKGVDEPDIVKTDGENLFVSMGNQFYPYMMEGMPQVKPSNSMMVDDLMIAPQPDYAPQVLTTKVIDALPADAIKELAKIPATGDLLLSDDTLMVFENDQILAFDISSPTEPKKLWDVDFEDQTSVHTVRLIDGKLYVLTQSYLDYGNPCPIDILRSESNTLTIPCTELYHPIVPTQSDVTYTALEINVADGSIENDMSLIGSSQTTTYVSENALYVSYVTASDYADFLSAFFAQKGSGLVPSEVINKLNDLAKLDISNQAKAVEIEQILNVHRRNLSSDDRALFENEMTNRMEDFANEKKRDLESTAIVKIDLSEMSIAATGNVPGRPLNQFSMDEYENTFRIATTVGEGFGDATSANDVYVLDQDLKRLGSVIDMGEDERIYSVRFMGDMGYLVTFRQTDPFYVLDLSNPKDPRVVGELKIPGYSSYLHALTEELVLGVGQDEGKVKLSLFDVSDPANPQEVSKYLLDAYWTDVSNNHHAFLQDEKHTIFFLPAGEDGFVVSYEGDELSLKKVVTGAQAKRALYLDDNLYIVGEEKIVVLNETSWETVNTFKL